MSVDSGNILEPGTIVTLRAIYRYVIVLIPGYTLPIKTVYTSERQVLKFYRNPVAVLPGRYSIICFLTFLLVYNFPIIGKIVWMNSLVK